MLNPWASPRPSRSTFKLWPVPGNVAFRKILMLIINDSVVSTQSNGPCCTSLWGLLCTNSKIDNVPQRGSGYTARFFKDTSKGQDWPSSRLYGQGAAGAPAPWSLCSTVKMRICLSSSYSSVNPRVSCSPLILENQSTTSNNLKIRRRLLWQSFFFPWCWAQSSPEPATIVLITHICAICRWGLNLGSLRSSLQLLKASLKQCSSVLTWNWHKEIEVLQSQDTERALNQCPQTSSEICATYPSIKMGVWPAHSLSLRE